MPFSLYSSESLQHGRLGKITSNQWPNASKTMFQVLLFSCFLIGPSISPTSPLPIFRRLSSLVHCYKPLLSESLPWLKPFGFLLRLETSRHSAMAREARHDLVSAIHSSSPSPPSPSPLFWVFNPTKPLTSLLLSHHCTRGSFYVRHPSHSQLTDSWFISPRTTPCLAGPAGPPLCLQSICFLLHCQASSGVDIACGLWEGQEPTLLICSVLRTQHTVNKYNPLNKWV